MAEAGSLDLRVACIVQVKTGSSTKILDNLRLIASPKDATRAILRDASGSVWFSLDHAHPDGNGGSTAGHHADLRLGPALAAWLGKPSSGNIVAGGMDWQALTPGSAAAASLASLATCTSPWASAKIPAKIRLIVMAPNYDTQKPDTIAFERCSVMHTDGRPRPCTNDSKDGQVVFAPDASLENVGTSAIPWYGMFSGRFPPYDNDQHPLLIWNLYRVDRDGLLLQIGKSGVKHAFYAINIGCHCPGGHVVYPTCQDTYSSFNNDSLPFLGPREEVIPSKGIWAPCGSVFDSDCDGIPGPRPPGQDDGHRWRMDVSESELLPDLHPGARFYFEYGYITRDQDDPERSFGFREVHPRKVPGANGFAAWQLDPSALQKGFVTDHWVTPPAHSRYASNVRFVTAAGSGRVVVRVVPISKTRYQYTYAIHNIDLVAAHTSGEAPRLRIDSSHGIDRIALPATKGSQIEDASSSGRGGDSVWLFDSGEDQASWRAPEGQDLSWGSIHTLRFQSDMPPHSGTMRLHVNDAAAPIDIEVTTIVPSFR
jgi:hypothetical protein